MVMSGTSLIMGCTIPRSLAKFVSGLVAVQTIRESLNKHLLTGPDLTNGLVGVLCRFRRDPVAFMCDLKGMFHQFKVDTRHRNLLRFLWWPDGDIKAALFEYRMTAHLFGAGSSPEFANFALKRIASDHEKSLDKM